MGLGEKVKTSICEVVDLFAKRYEEEFTLLPAFVETIWTLLTNTSLESKNDLLSSKAMAFLTSVVRQERHKPLFENPDVLKSICLKVVLPNIELRGLLHLSFCCNIQNLTLNCLKTIQLNTLEEI